MQLSEGAVGFDKVTILSSGTISDHLKLEDGVYPVGIFHPILTTSTAIQFQVSDDGNTFTDMFNEDGTRTEVVVAPASDGYTVLPIIKFAGVKHLKLEVADAQAADRLFKVATRGV